MSPADADPDGANLPVVRVDESGALTVVETIQALSRHTEALEGPVEFAAQCQAAWNS